MGVATSKRALVSPGELQPPDGDSRKQPWVSRPHTLSQHNRWVYCQSPLEDAAQAPPSPRSGHTVCLLGGKVYLFGGCGRSAGVEDYCLADLHSLDVETLRWENIEAKGTVRPAVRRSAAMCAVGDGRFLLSGGAGDDPDHLRSDLYMFDTRTRTWTMLLEGDDAKPFCLCGQSACCWRGTVLFFGGSTGLEYSNELFSYDLRTNRWQQLATKGPRPTPRYKHQAFIHNDCMYVVGGGCFKPLCEDTDVHKLDLLTMEWTTVATKGAVPMARVAHTCAYDSTDGGAVYMWGGFTAGLQCLRNFYKLALDTHTWTSISPPRDEVSPSARSFHGSVFTRGCIYILSGSNGSEKFADVWRYAVRETPPPLLTLAARAVLANSSSFSHAARVSVSFGQDKVCSSTPSRTVSSSTSSSSSGSISGSSSGAECQRRHSTDAMQDNELACAAPLAGHTVPAWQQWPFSGTLRTEASTSLRAPLSSQQQHQAALLSALPQELVEALSHMNALADRIV